MHPAMEIHRNAQIHAHSLPDGGHPFHSGIQLIIGIDPFELICAVHFHGLVALGQGLMGMLDHIPGMIAPNPAIDLDFIPHPAAQEFIHGHAMEFALDIPQGLLNAGKGAGEHRAAPVKAGTIEHLENILNISGGFADEGAA